MDKKKGIILIVVLVLLIGLSSFVFTQSGEKPLDNNNTNINENEGNEQETVVVTPTPKPQTSTQSSALMQMLIKAKEAIKKAEETLTQEDVDAAKAIIEKISSLKHKTELLKDLEKIQKSVDVKTVLDDLNKKITEAENKNDIEEVRNYFSTLTITDELDALEDNEIKTTLEDVLLEILDILEDDSDPVIDGITLDERTNLPVTLTVNEEVTFEVTLNGEKYSLESLENIEEDGKYFITVYDRAKNSASISFTIDTTSPVITGIDKGEYTYNGTGVTPETTDEDVKTVVLTKDDAPVDNYALGTAIKEIGKYVLTVTDALDQETKIEFEIKKADPVITFTAPNLTYNAETKEYDIKVEGADGIEVTNPQMEVLYYDLSKNEPGTTIAPTLPGIYKIEVKLDAIDDRHNAITKEEAFEITKAEVKTEIIKPNLSYNTIKKDFVVRVFNVKDNEILSYTSTIEYYDAENNLLNEAPTLPGSYKVVVKVNALNENYIDTTIEEDFEITKGKPIITLIKPNLEYDGNSKEYEIKIDGSDGAEITNPNYTVEYYDIDNDLALTGAPTESGTYKIVVTVPAIDEYHEDFTKEETFEIVKTVSDISSLSSAISNATDGDIIVLNDGEYNIDTLVIDKNITLRGKTANVKLVLSGNSEIGVHIKANVTLENLSVITDNDTVENIKVFSGVYTEIDGVDTLTELDEVAIKNVTTTGGKTGINIHGVKDATIEGVTVDDAEDTSIIFASTNATVKDTTVTNSGTNGALVIEYTPFEDSMDKNDFPSASSVTLESGNNIDGDVIAESVSQGNEFVGEDWTANVDITNDVASYTQTQNQ